jgi:hypothetical protein
MKKITSVVELKESIYLLEIKQANEKQLLKQQFTITYESLQPINVIKKMVGKLTNLPDFKGNILNAVVSLAAGYFSKKIAVGDTNNPVKQLLGVVLQMGVTNAVSKNGEEIKSTVISLLSKILNKKRQ